VSIREQLEKDFHAEVELEPGHKPDSEHQSADTNPEANTNTDPSSVTQPHQEELDFLYQRQQLVDSLPQTMTTEQFLDRYDEIERYALTDEILKRVDADVWHKCHYQLKAFIQDDFYRHFKHHWVIRQYLDPDYIEAEYVL
jgi:hypothetical protein